MKARLLALLQRVPGLRRLWRQNRASQRTALAAPYRSAARREGIAGFVADAATAVMNVVPAGSAAFRWIGTVGAVIAVAGPRHRAAKLRSVAASSSNAS